MMRILFFIAAILCLTSWGISVFVYSAGELIHVLLAFTAIFCVLGVMGNEQHGPVSNPDLF